LDKDSKRLRYLILAGVLVAMAVVLKTFAITTPEFRFSFYDIPLFLGGMILGPGLGLIMGFATDWLYVMVHPMAFSFNLMTISAMLWGFMGGLFFYNRTQKFNVFKVTFIIILTSLLTFSLNSVQLYIWTGSGMIAQIPFRLLTTVIKWPIQVIVLKVIHTRILVHTELAPFL